MSSGSSAITFRQSLALVWRTLRSMRTALVLLLVLALASVVGSLVPQMANSPERVAAMFRSHPLRAAVYDRLGLFDVFGSWWFTLVYTLLLISLAACLLPRTRALIRNVRSWPQPAREVDGFRHYQERAVAVDPASAIAWSRRVLRRRWFRLSRENGEPALAADKGLTREAGSLLFHWSFFLLLVGIAWGKGTGFSGQAVIVEGQTWTEAHANYDGQIQEGRFFSEDHTGVQIRVRDFEDAYLDTGQPMDFVTRADLLDPRGRLVERVDIRVNHPAAIAGVKVYQFGFGWAPVLEVRWNGELVASGPVAFRQDQAPAGVSQLAMPWRGVVKLPSLSPQVGLELDLWPDSRALFAFLEDGEPRVMTGAFRPVLLYRAYRGDLHAERVQSSSELDRADLEEWTTGAIGAGQIVNVTTGEVLEPGRPDGAQDRGLTVSFSDIRQYTVLQVTRDRGLGLVLAAAILVLMGLLPALYASRRRVFVRAEREGGETRLRVGGFALQRQGRFEEEFAALVEELAGVEEGRRATEGVVGEGAEP